MTVDRTGDVDEFARLKADEDPRTIEQMIADDDYGDVVIEKAAYDESEGRTTISWDGGTTTSVQGPEVKVGDTVRFYGGAMLGDCHWGWALNGEVIEWQTPWERFAERVRWLASYDRDKRERFAQNRTQMDADYEALPPEFKARIDRFRSESPDFRIASEAYEMAAVKDAALFAARARDAAANDEDEIEVAEFWSGGQWWAVFSKLDAPPDDPAVRWLGWWWALNSKVFDYDHKRQTDLMPGINEGHSGNTFGGACSLAWRHLEGHDL